MSRVDRVAFILLAAVGWGYVIARAVLLPMVHDECASALWYVQPGEWLPYQSHWDANNHFLASGLGVLLARAFGMHPWVLRLGSLLAFGLFSWAAWRLGAQVRTRSVRWCFWLALLTCPFVLDFFSMFRGYAIELAGWAVALDGLLRYSSSRALRHLAAMLVGSMIAGAAIVALLPIWCIALGLAGVLFLLSLKRIDLRDRVLQLGAFLLLGVVPMIYIANLALHMKELGLLYYGSTAGFVEVTVSTLCLYVIGSDHPFVVLAVVVLVLIASITVLHKAWRERIWFSPQTIALVLLWTDVFARIAMVHVMEVNYPEDRAGIHLIPLVLLLFALAIDGLAVHAPVTRWSGALLLVLPLRALFTANMDHCVLWPEQCIPTRFVERVLERQRTMGRGVVLGAHHQSVLPWPMLARFEGREAPMVQTDGFRDALHDLRLIDARFRHDAWPGYHAIDSATGPGLWLLERDHPLQLDLRSVVAGGAHEGVEEFMEIVHVNDSLLRERSVYLDIAVPLTGHHVSPDVQLVLEVNDSTGAHLNFDATKPGISRYDWQGDTLRMTRTLQRAPTAVRAVVYLHNPRHEKLRVDPGRIITAEVH